MTFYIANHVVRERPWLRTLAIFWGIIAGLCGNAVFAQTMAANAASQPNAGRQTFEAICAGCHGLDAKGGERGPDIATRQQIVQLSDEKLMEILRGGRPAAGMPPFEYLGSAKLKDVLDYLRTLQGKGSTASVTGNPANGKTLFFGGARCSECHMVQGAGGFLGRDLSNYGATLSAAEIRANIVKPGDSKVNKTASIAMFDGQKFSGVIRNEDNFSIQLQSFDGAFHFLNRSAVAHLEFLPDPIMPADYSSRLKASELDDLVSYLITVAKTGQTKKEWQGEDEN
jgi:putative heme-binding domain-containing protein